MRKILLLMALLCSFAGAVNAQNRTVTGTVTDKSDGSSIPGVSVIVAGSRSGTQTGVDGKFSISVPAGKALVFSSLGYTTQTLTVSGTTLNVQLAADARALSEVVVTGYGVQRRSTPTGSVNTIDGADLTERPVPSFDQALAGKAPGVQITTATGVLNAAPVFRIRGTNSISLSSYPLIVVDGVASFTGDASGTSASGNALSSINPNDIESVTILKDAAAAAIYGSRAANGVVLITTKVGKKGKAIVSYDGWASTTKTQRLPELLDAFEYTDLKNEGLRNAGTFNAGPTGTLSFYALTNDASGNPINTNWYDVVYQDGFSHSNSLNVSGGTDATSYYFSGNFTDQNGILRKNTYDRKAGLFKLDHKVGSALSLGGKISYANEGNAAAFNTGSLNGDAFTTTGAGRLAIVSAPNVSPYNNDGTYNVNNTINFLGQMNNKVPQVGFYNPKPLLDLNKGDNELNRLQSNVYLNVSPLSWLTARTVFGLDYLYAENDIFGNPIHGDSFPSGGTASQSYSENKRWVWTNTLQGDHTFGEKHNASVLLGNEQQRSTSQGFTANRTTLSDPSFTEFAASFVTPGTNASIGENYLVSFFANVSYDFDKKYYVSGNIRQDQYSAFGADRKKGTFYGVGLGYDISQEGFWAGAGLDKVFNRFKLKASYGTVGNFTGLGNFASYSFYGNGLYGGQPTLVPTSTGNPGIGWESSKKTDIGVDFGLFDNRISIEAAYYNNKIDDLIFSVPQVPSAGLPSSPDLNIGSMYNRGLEFQISGDVFRSTEFTWTPSFNISYNKNEVTYLTPTVSEFTSITSGLETVNITRVGSSLGQLYVVPTAGVDPATGRRIFIQKSTGRQVYYYHVVPAGAQRWAYADGTASAPISLAADAVAVGNSMPKYYGGLDNTLRYKAFDLNMLWTFQLGYKLYYGTQAGLRDQRFWNNETAVLRRWTTPGQVTDIPKVYAGDNVSNGSSFPIDANVYNGNFLKLRNINLGYELPSSLTSKIKVNKARVYISTQNAIIITKYPGSDPEVSSNGNSTTSQGVDRNGIGNAVAFTAGLSVKF